MNSIIETLKIILLTVSKVISEFESEQNNQLFDSIIKQLNTIEDSFSGSWIGYHSTTYLKNFKPQTSTEYFDREWGLMDNYLSATAGNWKTYTYAEVIQEINRRCGQAISELRTAANHASSEFVACQSKCLPAFDVLLSINQDTTLSEVRNQISNLRSAITAQEYITSIMPKQFISRDHRAMAEGIVIPPHIKAKAEVMEIKSVLFQTIELEKQLSHSVAYLELKENTKMESTIPSKNVFLGHGRSPVWKDLDRFLRDRLHLETDEFNREPIAGMGTQERLSQMLDNSVFAFLLMTAEDEHSDGALHARQNVIHEVGLFQGRLGFRKAIILLEEGCQEFSNIIGLGQIRFPKGDIKPITEEIRSVLERENII